jgi:hypothetical protein
MAATFAFRSPGEGFNPSKVPGAYFDALITVTGDNSYPTGGYPFGITQLNTLTGGAGSLIESVEIANNWTSGTTGAVAVFEPSTGKVRAIGGAASGAVLAELTAATNITAFACTLRVRWH